MVFNWELNPATLLTLALAALGVIRAFLSAENQAKAAEKRAAAAEAKADAAHEKIAVLHAALSAYRETQAERLVSREVLREVENRLSGSIDTLGERFESLGQKLDGLITRMLDHKS